jgi:outer membrane protein insertion porin family
MYRQRLNGSLNRPAARIATDCSEGCEVVRSRCCQHPLENERMSPQFTIGFLLERLRHAVIAVVMFATLWSTGCQVTEPVRAFSPPIASSPAPSNPSDFVPQSATTIGGGIRSDQVSNPSAQVRYTDYPDQRNIPAVSGVNTTSTVNPPAVPVPVLSSQAVIRGQSGEGWVASPGTSPQQSGGSSQQSPTTRYQLPAPPAATGNPPYGPYAAPNQFSSDYAGAVAPGSLGGQMSIAPGTLVMPNDPLAGLDVPNISAPGGYQPRMQIAPLDVYLQEARTGRIILGGSVNSDLGVAGQLIIDERNFDIWAPPRSWSDVFSGYAFRGAGQSFRAELMPGNLVERYTVNWSTPNMFGYLPYSLSVGGYLFSRLYRDWTEQRLGGRVGVGYAITKDLSIGTEIRGENVKIMNPRVNGVEALDDVVGDNELYTARFRINRDTRDSVFLATEGTLLELIYDQSFGSYDFPQGLINFSHYSRVHERPDGMGRHVLVNTWRVGFSGKETPIYENFFAGGFSTLRGFRFRGASPVESGVQVGGRFMFLGSLEYMFPLTADEMLRGVAFVDYGTIERDVTFNKDTFRVAPGLGVRIAVPALGPAPLAFDFAIPVAKADGDEKQLLSFYMGFTR